MTRLTVATLAIVSPLATSCGQEAESPQPLVQPAPNIELDITNLDFGKMWDPTIETQQVTIRNTGNADLLLTSLASTCGCTVPRIGDSELVKHEGTAINVRVAPGESVVMDITVNTFAKRDKLKQKVTVTSNDPDSPEVYVHVVGFVEPQVRIQPWVLDLGKLEKGESVTRLVTIISNQPTFKLGRVSFGGTRGFKSKILATEQVEIEGYKRTKTSFEVFFRGSTKPGSKLIEATLRTNHKQQRLLTMRIEYEILGDLEMPKVLQLGTLDSGTMVERTFKVTSRSGTPFKVLSVRHAGKDGAAVEFSATPNDADRPTTYDVTVRLPNAPEQGSMRGVLIVATDVIDEEAIEVRYQGIVLAGPPK